MVLRVRKYDLGKNYANSDNMRHGRLDFISLCYMVVFAKECMDLWSARLLLSSHSAQNPLDIDNDWMYTNMGITKSVETMVNCGIN